MTKNIIITLLLLLSVAFFFYGLTQQMGLARVQDELNKCTLEAERQRSIAEETRYHAEEMLTEFQEALKRCKE